MRNTPEPEGSRSHRAEAVIRHLGDAPARILLWGEMGVGKSTLARALVEELGRRMGACQWLVADPGSPLEGLPGAVTRLEWRAGDLRLAGVEALCTLDAARFRLPLIRALGRLLDELNPQDSRHPMVIDPPGVTRGVAGSELLTALVELFEVDWVAALQRDDEPIPYGEILASQAATVLSLRASQEARRPSKRDRTAHRTHLWNRYLEDSEPSRFALATSPVTGTPPPRDVPEAWRGRQAALLDEKGRTVQMGEVTSLDGDVLTLRTPTGGPTAPARLLVRDALRTAEGTLETAPRVEGPLPRRPIPAEMVPPSSPETSSPPVSSHVGWAWATLVGGVFGDPLLHVRLRHRKRSLLFDLGDAGRLAARAAHQVSDVFLSHAHIDHIGGFPWFLRSRIGSFPPCRIFGPAETIERIEHFIAGVTWDRIRENGPVFEVAELHPGHLRWARLQPGRPRQDLPHRLAADGILLDEPEFTVRAAVCDHGIPALAYAFHSGQEINVRKDRLQARGLEPGPWLGQLKHSIAAEDLDASIPLPGGGAAPASELAEDLLLIRPGKKLAYAADTADTPENRRRLTELAEGAHTFFCEAAFAEEHREQAVATQHLTAQAAGEIARAAGVERMVPFHFSRRYEDDPQLVYREVLAAAGPVTVLGRGIPAGTRSG